VKKAREMGRLRSNTTMVIYLVAKVGVAGKQDEEG